MEGIRVETPISARDREHWHGYAKAAIANRAYSEWSDGCDPEDEDKPYPEGNISYARYVCRDVSAFADAMLEAEKKRWEGTE